MREQHAGVDEQDRARGRRQPSQRGDEQRAAIVDGRQRRELAGDVEPGGEPAPALAPEPARPVIHRPGRGQRGRQLRHAERDGEREHADQRPAERHLGRPAHRQPVLVERHGAREDRDDRKRNGEVGEPAHRPEQLLRIAERTQLARVVAELFRLQKLHQILACRGQSRDETALQDTAGANPATRPNSGPHLNRWCRLRAHVLNDVALLHVAMLRIEMIENEMAKFENPPILGHSSCG